jgi:hypothetical protein
MSETRWTVQERTWKDELPELPEDLSALLAPPVVVSASGLLLRTAGRPVPRAKAKVG